MLHRRVRLGRLVFCSCLSRKDYLLPVLKALGVKGWAVDVENYSARLVMADGSRSGLLRHNCYLANLS